ncbi:MAG: lipoyl(octanoyl) transferase LipB [Pseudomonadota bacterium]
MHLCRVGEVAYAHAREAMARYTSERDSDGPDEVWLVEHPPVFTLGLNASREHVLVIGDDIPVVDTDRGGQVTYHGPGQLVLYPLLALRRYGLGARSLVSLLEQSVVSVLAPFGIEAAADPAAPGVYVQGRKIASIGLRIRRGCSYHGIALNVNADLSPFARINPCGYQGLEVTRMIDEGAPRDLTVARMGDLLSAELLRRLAYNTGQPLRYVEQTPTCAPRAHEEHPA